MNAGFQSCEKLFPFYFVAQSPYVKGTDRKFHGVHLHKKIRFYNRKTTQEKYKRKKIFSVPKHVTQLGEGIRPYCISVINYRYKYKAHL